MSASTSGTAASRTSEAPAPGAGMGTAIEERERHARHEVQRPARRSSGRAAPRSFDGVEIRPGGLEHRGSSRSPARNTKYSANPSTKADERASGCGRRRRAPDLRERPRRRRRAQRKAEQRGEGAGKAVPSLRWESTDAKPWARRQGDGSGPAARASRCRVGSRRGRPGRRAQSTSKRLPFADLGFAFASTTTAPSVRASRR